MSLKMQQAPTKNLIEVCNPSSAVLPVFVWHTLGKRDEGSRWQMIVFRDNSFVQSRIRYSNVFWFPDSECEARPVTIPHALPQKVANIHFTFP